MSQDHRIRLICQDCKKGVYNSTKNKKQVKKRLDLNKYCDFCKKHSLHKEGK